MDIERCLVSKIIFTGQIEKAIGRSIDPDMFMDDECRVVYQYILDYSRKYASCPSLEAAKSDNPEFEWIQIQDTLDYVLDKFAKLVKRRVANDMLEELAGAADDPKRHDDIDIEFLEAARKLIMSTPSVDVDRFSEIGRRMKQYHEDAKTEKPPGVPFGFPTLDRFTGGLQGYELATVLGFTNVGKSTLLRAFTFNYWSEGYTPLYISLEMEAKVLLRIFDAMAAHIDYIKLKHLRLSEDDLQQWEKSAERIRASTADIPIIDSLHRVTPDRVFAETLKHKPDVVIIDYVGLMRSSAASRGVKRYQQIAEITQDLKHYARSMKIPIIMAAQTNRSGAKDGAELENVGDGISISQDSDIVIGLFQDADMERDKEMEIRLNKNRDGPRGKFRAIWDFENLHFREKTMKDVMQRA